MKSVKVLLLLLFFSLTVGMKCKKTYEGPDKDALPAETQSGKNTFGFLLNGEVWVPKGGLLQTKLDLSYDPTRMGGALSISANQLISDDDKKFLSLGGTNINKTGVYQFSTATRNVNYSDTKIVCDYTDNNTITGYLNITRFDLAAKIISGTFSFKLEKDGCPSINATEGRFDMRIE